MRPLAHALNRTLSVPRDGSYQPPAALCPHCGDTGRIISRRTRTASRCSCLPELTRRQTIAALREHSGMPPRPEATFERLDAAGPPGADAEIYRKAWQTAAEYADQSAGMLTIAGGPGTGKTSLALAVAHRALEQPHPLVWTSAGELLRSLRQTADYSDETPTRSHDSVLVIDDIPLRTGTPWEQEQLRTLIAARDDRRQPTVCVLRGLPEQASPELAAKLGRQDATHRCALLSAPAQPAQRLPPPPMAQAMTFENFSAAGGELTALKDTALRWAQAPVGWLYITGPPGTGKTHLAVAIATHRAQSGDSVHFVTSPDLMAELRAASAPGAGSETDPLQHALDAALLVLDDLGAERFTAFADEQLTRLLGHRYDHRRPTVLTTNLTATQMATTRPRLASRIADQFVTSRLPTGGPDYRSHRPETPSW